MPGSVSYFMDAYSYRCELYKALSDVAVVVSVTNKTKIINRQRGFRANADAMIFPYACCNNIKALSKCKSLLLPGDPPLVAPRSSCWRRRALL